MPHCRFPLMLAIAAALSTAGCTFWGFVVGTQVDSDGEKTRPLAGWQIEKIGKGEKILVRLRDGRELNGEFQGTEISTPEYAVRHAAAVELLRPVALPGIGDSITVKLSEGKIRSGSLIGFEPTRILLEGPKSKAPLVEAPRHHAKGRVVGTLMGAAIDITLGVIGLSDAFGEAVPTYTE